MEKDFALRICEAGDIVEVVRLFKFFRSKYAKQKKADFAIISAHGTGRQLHFGKPNQDKNFLDVGDFQDQRMEKYGEIFHEQAHIIIDVCKTGDFAGIGHEIAACFHREVIAPLKSAALKHIEVKKVGEFMFFDVSYSFGVKAKYISA